MKRNFAFWHHYLMRLKPANSVFLLGVFCTLVSAIQVSAQEGRPEVDVLRSDPDPVTISDSETKIVNKSTPLVTSKETQRDSVQVRPSKAIKANEKTEEKEEDPLSFNFLYYIIEKFKLSDVID
jgi:hypothetical protein